MSAGAGCAAAPVAVRTPEDLSRAVESASREKAIGVALVTSSDDPFLGRMRALAIATDAAVYRISLTELPGALENDHLRRLLEADTPVKVCHDAKRAVRFFEEVGIRLGRLFDPKVAAQIISGNRDLTDSPAITMTALADRWLGVTLAPDTPNGMTGWAPDGDAHEAATAVMLRTALIAEIRRLDLVRVTDIEMKCLPAIARMEHNGLRVDTERWERVAELAEAGAAMSERMAREAFVTAGVTRPVDLRNPADLLKALEEAGVRAQSTRKERLMEFAGSPIVDAVLEFKRCSGYAASYGRNFLSHVHPVTGRIHADFQQIGAPTGRIQARTPPVMGIPKAFEFRDSIRPRPGEMFVVADCGQMELRILAELSGDRALRDAFNTGADLHRGMAARMYGVEEHDVTPAQRASAKAINFGMSYGMGPGGLATRLKVDVRAAEAMIAQYFRAVPGVDRYLAEVGRHAAREGWVRVPGSGRLITYSDGTPSRAERGHLERQGKNAPMQATNADVLKRALALLDATIAEHGARLVNCVHDEVVVEGPAASVDAIKQTVERGIITAAREFVRSVPVVVDLSAGDSWARPGAERVFAGPRYDRGR